LVQSMCLAAPAKSVRMEAGAGTLRVAWRGMSRPAALAAARQEVGETAYNEP
jgi:hypothetical protein